MKINSKSHAQTLCAVLVRMTQQKVEDYEAGMVDDEIQS